MKQLRKVSAMLLVAAASVILAGCITGCKTAQADGTKVYDPVKTQAVKDALQAPVERTVSRIILNSPKHSDELAKYFSAAGAVFCQMKESGQLDPTVLVAGLDKAIPADELAKKDEVFQYALDFKSTAIALYKQFFNDRYRAELPPEEWPYHVADFFCISIDSGLKGAGKPGIR